jgi:hypothetical protein
MLDLATALRSDPQPRPDSPHGCGRARRPSRSARRGSSLRASSPVGRGSGVVVSAITSFFATAACKRRSWHAGRMRRDNLELRERFRDCRVERCIVTVPRKSDSLAVELRAGNRTGTRKPMTAADTRRA